MRPGSHILDDMARVAGGAVNVMSGLRQQIYEEVRVRMEDMASRMDLVPREDFDQAQAMIARLRQQQDDMAQRLAALEDSGKQTKKRKQKKKA